MGRFLLFWGMQPAARIICPLRAGKFHTCGLRRVISNAHVVGNDDQNYFASADAKICDALCLLPPGAANAAILLFQIEKVRCLWRRAFFFWGKIL